MALENPFPIYCYVSSSSDQGWLNNAVVSVYGPGGSTSAYTNANGFCIINIQDVATDGQNIYVSGSYQAVVGGSKNAPWEVNVDLLSKEINISIDVATSVGDMSIYYSSLSSPHNFDCWCTRWDQDNYTVTIETFIPKVKLQLLRNHIKPGAVGELYQVLGRPHYYDKTWSGDNTLKIVPKNDLAGMRSTKIIYVKNFSTTHKPGNHGYVNVKIEGYVSGSSM